MAEWYFEHLLWSSSWF